MTCWVERRIVGQILCNQRRSTKADFLFGYQVVHKIQESGYTLWHLDKEIWSGHTAVRTPSSEHCRVSRYKQHVLVLLHHVKVINESGDACS